MSKLPENQSNAHLDSELMMRIGIPHKGGKLAIHASNKGYPAMVSASAFWDPKSNTFKIPDMTPLMEVDFALDSAGFTAMKLWKSKGTQPGMAGVFPWQYGQYIELANLVGCSWWSQPDLCCEPEIAESQEEVDYRVRATATLLEGTLRIVYAWQCELVKDWSADVAANMVRPPVPVLQGWSVDDYLRSLDLLLNVWERWQPWIAPPKLIGVGSVCRRNLHHPTHGLYAILAGLERHLPSGSRLHLFGVKGACLSTLKMLDCVASADSMAYDVSARIKAHQSGESNTMANRTHEMTRWMTAAAERLKPALGDQHRLFA